jgi:deazaflavin-dependent oxidoreductase (nitroreductase family)
MEDASADEAPKMRDVPIIVITSKGRKTGALRKNPVMKVEHDGVYAAVASKGGAPESPTWYFNMMANPIVEVQDGKHRADYSVRRVSGAEREVWWQRAAEVWPDYDEYQQKTEREIPVLVLEPVSD